MGNSSDASINASEESVHEDSSSYGEDGTSMSANGDVGVSSADDSDVEGGLMRLRPQQMPQHPSLIPLRQMLPETPHSQMYTMLLDKDGKVVDTNDPDRAIDRRYKSVGQGGEGTGLPKGGNVTVHFRMAAVTPNNADADGTGVQEDTTYYMELPWQLVAAKQHRLRYRCVYRLQ